MSIDLSYPLHQVPYPSINDIERLNRSSIEMLLRRLAAIDADSQPSANEVHNLSDAVDAIIDTLESTAAKAKQLDKIVDDIQDHTELLSIIVQDILEFMPFHFIMEENTDGIREWLLDNLQDKYECWTVNNLLIVVMTTTSDATLFKLRWK
jgi:hypothetical protein